uniref:Uncharacterized protein n=1 Tax=Arion vulgaris TaxID=1028688 RepID=A0A0B7AFQ7_9EUPU
MSSYQSHKTQPHNSPFVVQHLPKSFYHPSPTKTVDESQAIKSPQRRHDTAVQNVVADRFLKEGSSFKTSALPNIKTLHELTEGHVISSNQMDETWPDSQTSTSVSASVNTSSVTSMIEDSQTASPNVGNIITGLERLTYQHPSDNFINNKTQNDNVSRHDTGQSVLQNYIKRFRQSAPKSREERMKEKGEQLQFWWLHSSPDSRYNSMEVEQGRSGRHLDAVQESTLQQQVESKLTREALLTMDEQTFHLQSKTDRLLSRSELSLASSSPIVSTDGVGASTSVDSSSNSHDQAPYQSAFSVPDTYHRPASKPLIKRGEKSQSWIVTSKTHADDDILTRWRLRRKLEDSSAAPQFERLSNVKPLKHTELLDSRLEEFRHKILSQKALVTHEDIQFERQRMDMLLDDGNQDENLTNKIIPQTAGQHLQHTQDTVLERLSKITGSGNHSNMSFAEGTKLNMGQEKRQPFSSSSISTTADYNFSINNANVGDGRFVRHTDPSWTPLTLDRNNTASSEQQTTAQDTNINNDGAHDIIVDSFGSQVVCDAKKKGFFLGNSQSESARQGRVHSNEDRQTSSEDKKVETEDFQNQRPTEDVCVDDTHVAKNRQCTDEDINMNTTVERTSKNAILEPSSKNKILEESSKNITETYKLNMSIEGATYVDKSNKQVTKRSNGNFYKFLEAEKPISECKKSTKIRDGKKDEMVRNDDNDQIVHEEKEMENISPTGASMNCVEQVESKVIGDEKNIKGKEKTRQVRNKTHSKKNKGGDVAEEGVLTDITNEGGHLSERLSHSRMPGHRSTTSKFMSNQNKDVNLDKSSPVQVMSESSPRCHSTRHRVASSGQQPVQYAIGQTVADHLFDNSTLLSSVDSWASMFAQSPGRSQSMQGSGNSLTSPAPSLRDKTPLESTPIAQSSSDQQVVHDDDDEDYESDGEFNDDPLLEILRQQRDQYLLKLKYIEERLQDMET